MIIIRPPSHRQGKPDLQRLQQSAEAAGVVVPDIALVALQQGRLIEAIKVIRTANPGLDLGRAKSLMQRMQRDAANATPADAGRPADRATSMPTQSRRPPTVAMGDPPGQVRWLLLVLALLAIAGWLAFGSMGGSMG